MKRLVPILALLATVGHAQRPNSDWLTFGGDAARTGWARTEKFLSKDSASRLELKWKTQLDTHPTAIDTASPVVLNGVIYTGVAALEEAAAANPAYPCCSFRGSAVAVSVDVNGKQHSISK